MGGAVWTPVDPNSRFSAAVRAVDGSVDSKGRDLTAAALASVIAQARKSDPSDAYAIFSLSDHIARHSSLTAEAVTPIVSKAFASASDDVNRASAASAAVAPLEITSTTGTVSLSDPVMLGTGPRLCSAALLSALALLGAIFSFKLPQGSTWEAYLATILSIVLGVVGILIVVMGYRTVNISGSFDK